MIIYHCHHHSSSPPRVVPWNVLSRGLPQQWCVFPQPPRSHPRPQPRFSLYPCSYTASLSGLSSALPCPPRLPILHVPHVRTHDRGDPLHRLQQQQRARPEDHRQRAAGQQHQPRVYDAYGGGCDGHQLQGRAA
ncbi:hypothetical protein B484DRAFT_252065 [Ochromonadaceae sp. CCMP2298]|nr:hypothetical protein B484DRAFT_252065 [Ochromonadaceae sp. CCMP2298]